ncbi:MAG: DNA polymerase I [Ruminococcaceae bacterium]|nr:DNA polymerase I [Oscillospiraceae bacterium]
MKKMLVIDGNSILNRAFYGIKLLTNKDGLYTNAVYGMINIIQKHIEGIKPDYCAVAFDLKAPTFRHKRYDGYKANRKGMPEELAVQLPYAKECMSDMGLKVITCEGYEADDILGTLSEKMSDEGVFVYILTGDRDSLQLIDDKVSVLLVKTKDTLTVDRAEFVNMYGIEPDCFVDVKALMGDSSDNIPGVPGIGEKTALKLISDYHDIDRLYEEYERSSLTDGVKKKLSEGRESAYLSKELATICKEAPIDTEPSSYEYAGVNKKELLGLFLKLDFTGLIKRFGLDEIEYEESSDRSQECEFCACAVDGTSDLQGDILFVGVNGDILSLYDGKNIYKCGLNEISAQVKEILTAKKLICFDVKNLYKILKKQGISFISCNFDCMLAAYVLDSGRGNYSLDDLFVRYMNISVPENTDKALLVCKLYAPLLKEIEDGKFTYLLNEIEIPLAFVLADMELAGFKIDCSGIEEYGRELLAAEEALKERIYVYAGEKFNIGSPKQLGEVLFEKMGLPSYRKTKTGYSTDAETLQKLLNKHPIIEDILDYRQVAKLRSTYADGLVKAADTDGRIHCNLNQTGTATGRLSSSEPNLQNIPVRTELGRKFRKYFVPENSDYVLIDADYSQIELRLLAHIANDETLINAFVSGDDIHAMTASKVFSVPLGEVTPDLRKKAKAVNFGIMYGIGEYSLSEDLGISRKAAKEYIDGYFANFPQINEYLDGIKDEAKRDGFVTTVLGRRRYIPELASSNKNLQHFGERVAMNSPIQGTAADIIKLAMINVHHMLKEGGYDARLVMQVHDELIIEANKNCADEVKKLLIDCMENAVSLSVPMSVEANVGDTWYDAK